MGPIPAIANIWYNPENYRRPYDPNTGYYIDPQTGTPSPDVGPYSQPGWGQRVFNADATQRLIAANEQWINQARQARLNENIQVDRAGRDLASLPPSAQQLFGNGRAFNAMHQGPYGYSNLANDLTTQGDIAAGLPAQRTANNVNSSRLLGEQIGAQRQLLPGQTENAMYEQQYNVPAKQRLDLVQTGAQMGRQPSIQEFNAMQDEYNRREAQFRLSGQEMDQGTRQLGEVLKRWNAMYPMGVGGPQGMKVDQGGVMTYDDPTYKSKDIRDLEAKLRLAGVNLPGMTGPNAPVSYTSNEIGTFANPHYTPIAGTQRGVPTASVNNGGGAGPLANAPFFSGDTATSTAPAQATLAAPPMSGLIGGQGGITLPTSYDPNLRDKDIGFAGQGGPGSGFAGMANLANLASPNNFFNRILGDRGLGLGSLYLGPKVLPNEDGAAATGMAAGALIGASAGSTTKTNGLEMMPAKEVQPQELLPPPMQTPTNNPSSNPIEEVNVKNVVEAKNKKKKRRQLIAPISPDAFYGPYDPNFGRDQGF